MGFVWLSNSESFAELSKDNVCFVRGSLRTELLSTIQMSFALPNVSDVLSHLNDK
jgi:hypothetical protein